jgi:hypothetical protein
MCLSYPPLDWHEARVSAVSNEALATMGRGATHGKDVSCDNTLLCVMRTETGGVAVVQSIPVTGTSTVVFPIRPDHASRLVPCGTLECQTSKIRGITEPHRYVAYMEETAAWWDDERPVYRSLGAAEPRPRTPEIKPLQLFHNPDGGAVALIPIGEHVPRDVTPEQRARLGGPLLECVERGLVRAGFDARRVFGSQYDRDDPSTKFGFLGFLFDNITPACDIVIGIMPEGSSAGHFTFCYHQDGGDAFCPVVPVLGLTHGDLCPMQRVEDTFYVACNDPSVKITFHMDEPYAGENETQLGCDVDVRPKPPTAYVRDYYACVPEVGAIYRGPRGTETHGNRLWEEAQAEFQRLLVASFEAAVDEFVLAAVGVRASNTSFVGISNIKGTTIPRNTVDATLVAA